MIVKKILLLFLGGMLLSACVSKEDELRKAVESEFQKASQRVSKLEDSLSRGRVKNADILKSYSDILSKQKPELAALINTIARDAGASGPMFLSLKDRLQEYQSFPLEEQLDELTLITEASSINRYNDALSDSINVLADMSDNKLARVKSTSKAVEIQANKSKDYGAGSQYIGNSQYGQWQTSSNGTSFWAWYGMYSMFSNLTGGNRVYYGDWSRNRGHYSSPKQRKANTAQVAKTRKSFASKGQTFQSPYAKKRTGSSALSRSSHTASKSTSLSQRSSYAKNSSSAKRNNTTKSRSSRTRSRGPSRGK